MKAALRQFACLLLMVSCARGQGAPASLKRVKVTRTEQGIQIEVSLSDSVRPSVLTTTSPDRLILDFPNTTAGAKQGRISVNADGVRGVRFGLHASQPPVMRLVVDLDGAHVYELHLAGKEINLAVGRPAGSATRLGRGAMPAGSNGILLTFGRRPSSRRVAESSEDLNRPIPDMPPDRVPGQTTAPAASYPNRGSLQEGTVFPSLGTPGAGVVPSGGATARSTSSGPTAANTASAPASELDKAPTTVAKGLQKAAEAQAAPATNTVATDAVPALAPKDSVRPTTPTAHEIQPASSSGVQQPTQAAATPTTAMPTPPVTAPSEPTAAPETGDQPVPALPATDPNLKTVFKIRYVANGVVYLDGGRSSGLAEGMKLEVKDTDLPVKQGTAADPTDPRVVAELDVTAVAETSAVTDIRAPKRPVKEGDLAYLSNSDAQALIQQRTLSATRDYPIVIAFSEGDPMDEEVRKALPRPPQPSVNRARGRIGFDYMGTLSHGVPSSTNSDVGMVLRADITRIYGSHWNLSGYWRGRLHQSSAATQPTLQDLINRTYHLGMFYDNPDSRWVMGIGRLYLPWAPSLDTIDGGYFGAKLGGGATVGMFAGSTPDPTSWSYNPDQRLAGTFINFEGGNYDHFHYTSTSGAGISALKWQINRPFVFFENTLSYKRYISIYDSLQADSPRGNPAVPTPGPGLSRNFLTVRLQVTPRVELDFNHNYLRDIPTYDPTLVGTGLLDKYLFQGASAGARIEVVKQVFVYTNLGRSNRSGDAKSALNQLYGLTFNRLPWWGLRADAHYSRFNSSFADGSYRSFSLGRNVTDGMRLDILVGDQTYTSALAASDRTRFVNANFEAAFGPRYFMEGGFTINRGQTQNYDQWLFTLGYRFDSKAKHR